MDLIALIQDGSTSFAYLAMIGLVLGALHGLEPGHSKTMMAAFIVAVRGTPAQAMLLGVSAALSHSLIVWVLAVLALTYADEMIGERLEPYFILGSGILIVGVGGFMLLRALRLQLAHRVAHHEHHHHHHDHEAEDAHALAHAREIEQRFANGRATHMQTIGFGLVGGLIPCPAAITVLLLCLGINQLWLGVGMVASFSIGLAMTLVLVGLVAALGLRYASARYSGINRFLNAAPYISGVLIMLVGFYMAYSGYRHF